MALNVGRWLRYAQTRLSKTTEDANAELDRLEARREAERAEKPWLAADGEAPTLAEARARIEWEAQRQRDLAEQAANPADAGQPSVATKPSDAGKPSVAGQPSDARQPGDTAVAPPSSAPAPPTAEEAELASARIELDRRAAASKERLAAIREELGIDPPEDPARPGSPDA